MNKKCITILIPAFNEQEVLEKFYLRTQEVIGKLKNYNFELLFIDDGSRDYTLEILKSLRMKDSRVSYLSLSRNFGKEIAMAAGIDHVFTDALIIIDADLQDPPELIQQMIEKWEEGFDDVYAQRISRKGETWIKKRTSSIFYKLLAKLARIEIQADTGDFRMLSSKAIQSLKQLRETERYTKGLFSLIGHKKYCLKYQRDPRLAGKTKWNYIKLTRLAIQGITSFSTTPLKFSTISGLILAIAAFVYMTVIIVKTILYGEPVQGYPSLVSIVLFLGGIQLISIGIIGEYIGRTFMETKNRPLYFIQEYDSDYSVQESDKN